MIQPLTGIYRHQGQLVFEQRLRSSVHDIRHAEDRERYSDDTKPMEADLRGDSKTTLAIR